LLQISEKVGRVSGAVVKEGVRKKNEESSKKTLRVRGTQGGKKVKG